MTMSEYINTDIDCPVCGKKMMVEINIDYELYDMGDEDCAKWIEATILKCPACWTELHIPSDKTTAMGIKI